MFKPLFKTLVAVLAIAAAAAGPVRGQNSYNVTFGGFLESAMNTTVNVASLPQTFTQIGVYNFYPWMVISNGSDFISASVTSGGNDKVSVAIINNDDNDVLSITVTGTFEGTATIHVVGANYYENAISCDITVACTLPPQPHTVRLAAGTEDAANWTLASGNASVTGTQVLENVMSGSELTVTYSGTRKVKSVKAVKVLPPTITVDGLVLNGQDGDSWETLVAKNPGKIELASGQVYRLSDEAILMDGECGGASTNPVSSSTTYNASWADEYHWCE